MTKFESAKAVCWNNKFRLLPSMLPFPSKLHCTSIAVAAALTFTADLRLSCLYSAR